MTTAADTPVSGPPVVPASARGGTTIADRVVAKVASRAALEALRDATDTGSTPGTGTAAPTASVTVRHLTSDAASDEGLYGQARVRVSVELGYPCDIGARCAEVRRQVALRVRELVGMDVPEVLVRVARLHSPYLDTDGSGRVR
ncbi:hypothetical protein [Streptomyces sp. NPDC005438]|uniref:hypothetical protein n=1 Tax=Streptomyces sp. NPDC005438 TaxID=3156880 RepID=UPI0033BB9413